MKQPTQNKQQPLTLKELAFFGVYAALLIVLKEFMNLAPNIEPVSLMLIACTCVYGIKTLLPTCIFSMVQIVLHGVHIWNIMYLYVWAVLVFLVLALLPLHRLLEALKARKGIALQTAMWTVVAALYGLSFGTLCSVPYFFTLGPAGAVSWIISGFSFDIIHCIGNAIITAVGFYPLYKTLMLAKSKLA